MELTRPEPITTAMPVLSVSVLFVTDPIRSVYCSISRPEEAFDERFSQLLMVFPEIFIVKESMPVGA